MNEFKISSEQLSIAKVDENIPCGFSISIICTFDTVENKYHV